MQLAIRSTLRVIQPKCCLDLRLRWRVSVNIDVGTRGSSTWYRDDTVHRAEAFSTFVEPMHAS